MPVYRMNCQRAAKRTLRKESQARDCYSKLLLSHLQLTLSKATSMRCQRPSYPSSRSTRITCSRPWTAWHSPLEAKLSHLHRSCSQGLARAIAKARISMYNSHHFRSASPSRPKSKAGFTCFTKARCTRLLRRNEA